MIVIGARDLSAFMDATNKCEGAGSSGFAEIDELTGGMVRGRVWILTGRPGEGTTTLALQWAVALAGQVGSHVHLVTPRETPQAVASRLWPMLGRIPLHQVDSAMADQAGERRAVARERLAALSLSLYARGEDMYVPEVHPTQGSVRPTSIVIDDADLVSGVTPEWVSQQARAGAFVLLSLPRAEVLPGGDDWDLSPSWARVADLVIEIQHRDFQDPAHFRPGEADLHLRYNRNGYVRTVAVQHQAHFARFLDGAD